MLNVDEEILLNQLAQGIASDAEGEDWFGTQSEDDKRRLLRGLNNFISQARPKPEDVAAAIAESRLKPTLTQCPISGFNWRSSPRFRSLNCLARFGFSSSCSPLQTSGGVRSSRQIS